MSDEPTLSVFMGLLIAIEERPDLDVDEYLSEHPEDRDDCLRRLAKLRAAGMLGSTPVPLDGSERALRAGDELGDRFRLVEEVGRGGMGLVWRAWDASLQREVALKTSRLPADGLGDGSSYVARFLREARLSGQLTHPNIVPVHLLDTSDDGRVYLAMKLVQGETLAEVAERIAARDPATLTAFSTDRLVRTVISVCDALAYAHSHDVVHRDLKPSNVMVGEFGEVQVMDWGLAKVVGEREEVATVAPAPETVELSQTATGEVFGTPSYMAPEQARGDVDAVGPASDVFGVGALLMHLLTGRPPYSGRDRAELLAKARAARPDTEAFRAAPRPVPRELREVCLRAMAEAPSDRYASVTELAADLQAFLQHEPGRAWSDAPWVRLSKAVRRSPTRWTVAAAAVVIAAVGLYAWTQSRVAFAADRRARLEQLVDALITEQSVPIVIPTEESRESLSVADHPANEFRSQLGIHPADYLPDAWELPTDDRSNREAMGRAFARHGYETTSDGWRSLARDLREFADSGLREDCLLAILACARLLTDEDADVLDGIERTVRAIEERADHLEFWDAFLASKRGAPGELGRLIEEALVRDADAGVRSLLAVVASDEVEHEARLELLRGAALATPDSCSAHALLAYDHFRAERTVEALRHAEVARALAPESGGAWALYGLCLAADGRLAQAVECTGKGAELAPDVSRIWHAAGFALQLQGARGRDRGALERAVEAYERAIALPGATSQSYINLATVLRDLRREEEVEATLYRAVEVFPDDASLVSVGAFAMDRTRGIYATREFLLTVYTNGRRFPRAVAELGRSFQLGDQHEHAIPLMRESVELDPGLEDVLSFDPGWQGGKMAWNLPEILGLVEPAHLVSAHHLANTAVYRGEFQHAVELYEEGLQAIPLVESEMGQTWYELTRMDPWGSYRMAARAALRASRGEGRVHVPGKALIWDERAPRITELKDHGELEYIRADDRPLLREHDSWTPEYRKGTRDLAWTYLESALTACIADRERERPTTEEAGRLGGLNGILGEELLAPLLDEERPSGDHPSLRAAYEAYRESAAATEEE